VSPGEDFRLNFSVKVTHLCAAVTKTALSFLLAGNFHAATACVSHQESHAYLRFTADFSSCEICVLLGGERGDKLRTYLLVSPANRLGWKLCD